jgi:hypothetical protein
MAYGEPVTTALLGVDALYRAESGDEEGIVVVNMAAQTDLGQYASGFPGYDGHQALADHLSGAGHPTDGTLHQLYRRWTARCVGSHFAQVIADLTRIEDRSCSHEGVFPSKFLEPLPLHARGQLADGCLSSFLFPDPFPLYSRGGEGAG